MGVNNGTNKKNMILLEHKKNEYKFFKVICKNINMTIQLQLLKLLLKSEKQSKYKKDVSNIFFNSDDILIKRGV